MAQHPLDMGRQDKPRSDSTLAVTVGADGNVNYDAIVKQGRNKDKYIATTHDAMVPKLDRLKDVRSLPTYLWLVLPETSLLHFHSEALPQVLLGCLCGSASTTLRDFSCQVLLIIDRLCR